MGLRVNTNVASINAQRNLSQVSSRLSGNFARLSSGLRVNSAKDDAKGRRPEQGRPLLTIRAREPLC